MTYAPANRLARICRQRHQWAVSWSQLLIALCVLFAPPMVITTGPRIVEIEHEEVAVATETVAFLHRTVAEQPPPPALPRRLIRRPRRRPTGHRRHRPLLPRSPQRRARTLRRTVASDDDDGGDDDDEQG